MFSKRLDAEKGSPNSSQNEMSIGSITTVAKMRELLISLHDQYKSQWEKDDVIQFKNERMAILQRMWGKQVQFVIAYDLVTKEGYRLMAIDEGQEAGGTFRGGSNAYFYFQKMEFIR